MTEDQAQPGPPAGPHPGARAPTAGRSPKAWGRLLVATTLALAIDLGSKWLAFREVAGARVRIDRAEVIQATSLDALIPVHEPVRVIPSLLEFTLVLNPGAVFGIGAGQRWFFVIFTVAALIFALAIFARWTTPRDRLAHLALALLIAGGLGNLYDRVLFACVRDFIHPLPGMKLPFGIRWPSGAREVWPYVSNVADLFLLIGIGVLLVYSWRKPDESPEPASTPSPD
ncbi:MAG: signal peptidase II [Phycisphaerales bacterium JB059]